MVSDKASQAVHYLNNISLEERQSVSDYMFCDLTIVVDDREVTSTISALQDTGALQHSYIRQDVLEQYPEVLGLAKRTYIGNTKQADGESSLEVTHMVTVNAFIKHYDGTPVLIKGLKLLVARKLSQKLILGAPDMVRLAPTVFMSYFMAAVTANHSLTQVMDFIQSTYVNTIQSEVCDPVNTKDLGPLHKSSPTVLTVMTLNVNGIRSALENNLLQFLTDNPHDILVATELKLSEKAIPAIKQTLSEHYTTVEIHAGHNCAGVMIASKLQEEPVITTGIPHVDPTAEEPRVLTASFQLLPIVIVAVYAPFNNPHTPNRDAFAATFRQRFYEYLAAIHPKVSQRYRDVIVAGDFQVALADIDESIHVRESPGSTTSERQDFAAMLALGYTDTFRALNPLAREYTAGSTYAEWNIAGQSKRAYKRIDHILVSPRVTPLISTIIPTDPTLSDHSAVVTTMQVARPVAHRSSHQKVTRIHLPRDKMKVRNKPQPISLSKAAATADITHHEGNEPDQQVASESIPPPIGSSKAAATADNIGHQDTSTQPEPVQPQSTPTTHPSSRSETEARVTPAQVTKAHLRQSLARTVALHMLTHLASKNEPIHEESLREEITLSINVLFSERQKLVEKVVQGNTAPPPAPQPDAPEDSNFVSRDLPEIWRDAIKGTSKDELVRKYIEAIPGQVDPRLLEQKDWMEFLLSEEAIKVWASKVTGMTGIPELELKFDELNMPSEHRSQTRKVPLQLIEIVTEHILKFIDEGLFFRASRPAYTSPTVIAPKVTDPFFRLAIDYRWINQFIQMIQAHVPVILEEINKASGWKVFADIDWKSAFHQVPLHPKTSEYLTVITILGPVSPKYMMEGVAPASSVLQNLVAELFASVNNISICMFDNILTGAEDDKELLRRVKLIVEICVRHNIVLNFSKTFLGRTWAKFFGYELSQAGYKIDTARCKAMSEIPMPGHGKTKKENKTQMQSFLGFSVYFMHFVERYAHYAAPLHDMTREDFDWDKSTWTRDYVNDFETFKQKLLECMEIIYPDFTLEWILFVDASDVACGWVLIQLRPQPNGSFITEPLAIGSEKFSTAAAKWHINEKEAYALLRGLQANHHLVAMKPIFVATDHFNLASNEHANNKKITGYKQQWACYAFKGLLTLKGDQNVADFPTRAGVARDEEADDNNRRQLNFIAAEAAGVFNLETRASPKRFTFYIDGQSYFTGNLTNVRCQATKPDGSQCKNRTVIGAAICWIHLLRKHNLAIRDSQYGKGLFAIASVSDQLHPKPIVFKKGVKVIEYLGEEVKADVIEDRYGSKTAPYAMAKAKGLYVDAALLRGVGSLANHSPRPNCRAGLTNRNTITITAFKNIRHGEEIMLNYNNQSASKQSRYQFNEASSHSTNTIAQSSQRTPQRKPVERACYTPEQQEEAFRQSHQDKGVCYGRTKTVSRLFKFFPGHGLSVKEVIDRILDCTECQKYRWANPELKIRAEVKVIEFEDPYTTISIDGIPMSPADIHGNNHIHIIKNHGSGRVTLTAHRSKTDEEACDAILLYRVRNGNVTVLVSDQGSDYTANLVKKFNELVGIQHRLAITARPQTTGIEPVVGVLKRFIRALAHHQRFVDRWSEPRVLALAEMLFNDDVKEPKKISPNELTFGTQSPELRQLLYPVEGKTQLTDVEYLDVLRNDIKNIRSLYEAAKFEEQSKRLEQNNDFIPNKLQKGDFVLYDRTKGPKSNTFQPPLPGPFVVKEQRGNTIVANRFDDNDDVNIHVDKATVFVVLRYSQLG